MLIALSAPLPRESAPRRPNVGTANHHTAMGPERPIWSAILHPRHEPPACLPSPSSSVLLKVTAASELRAAPRGEGPAGRPSCVRALSGQPWPPPLPLVPSPAGLWKPEAAW